MELGFWWLLTVACLVWYSTVTVYVSIRGVSDIKHMLARLKSPDIDQDDDKPAETSPGAK